jgi:predicted Rossmann fold nucleotide-binding protein DprA/Smf involved in DNA uptake
MSARHLFPAHRPLRLGERALSAIPTSAARGGGRAPRIASRAQVEREIEAVARAGAEYLFLGSPEYPRCSLSWRPRRRP